jgi:FAD synthetase
MLQSHFFHLCCANSSDVIVTSGGVGPTHDDVTIKSVAVALNQELVLHDEMAKLLQEKMNQSNGAGKEPMKTAELTDAQRKMATLPARSKLKYLSTNPSDWPVLQCRNIFVLPGVPEFFATKISLVADYVSSDELERSAVYKVVLSVDEAAIVSILNAAVGEHPEVSFGSYPFVSHPDFKTVLTLEGRLKSAEPEVNRRKSFSKCQMDHHVRLALDYLLTHLPEGSILRVENDDGLL